MCKNIGNVGYRLTRANDGYQQYPCPVERMQSKKGAYLDCQISYNVHWKWKHVYPLNSPQHLFLISLLQYRLKHYMGNASDISLHTNTNNYWMFKFWIVVSFLQFQAFCFTDCTHKNSYLKHSPIHSKITDFSAC